MCLGIPGQVVEIAEETRKSGFLEGIVDFGGVRRRICLACVPDVRIGQYVIVHAGIAITVLDEDQAHAMLEDLRRLGELDAELEALGDATPPHEAGTGSLPNASAERSPRGDR